jgi:hypothetical protein
MQSTSKAFLGLVALTLAAATPSLAQDTTAAGRTPQPGQRADTLTMPGQGGAADTAGFAGMERNDPAGAKKDTTAVETGAVKPTEPQKPAPAAAPTGAAAESKDPNGFRWTEPSDFAKSGQTQPAGPANQAQPKKDTLTMPGQGGGADTSGYAGAERDAGGKTKPTTTDSTKP